MLWKLGETLRWLGRAISHYQHKIVFLFSEIFWLQFCTVGGCEDVSSIFILSMLESLKVHFAKKLGSERSKIKSLPVHIYLKKKKKKRSNYEWYLQWYHNVSVKFNLWIMSMNVRVFQCLVRLPFVSMAAFTSAGVDTTSWDGRILYFHRLW